MHVMSGLLRKKKISLRAQKLNDCLERARLQIIYLIKKIGEAAFTAFRVHIKKNAAERRILKLNFKRTTTGSL